MLALKCFVPKCICRSLQTLIFLFWLFRYIDSSELEHGVPKCSRLMRRQRGSYSRGGWFHCFTIYTRELPSSTRKSSCDVTKCKGKLVQVSLGSDLKESDLVKCRKKGAQNPHVDTSKKENKRSKRSSDSHLKDKNKQTKKWQDMRQSPSFKNKHKSHLKREVRVQYVHTLDVIKFQLKG